MTDSVGGGRLLLIEKMLEPVHRIAPYADQQRTRRTQRRISVSKMLARIRQHIASHRYQVPGRNHSLRGRPL